MVKLWRDADAQPEALRGKRVAILGYGSQGRAHALNLRDRGIDVRVLVRAGRSAEHAAADGIATIPPDAVPEADVIAFLVPDLAQPDLHRTLAPRLRGRTLLFAHGFCVHYGLVHPPADCDVVLVAPKAPGPRVREAFAAGHGVPCLAAVHQDASGSAWTTALAYAWAIGGTRAGVIGTTFRDETETDLFGEQAVLCGGMTRLVVAGFETLVEAGYAPEVAYFECLHELELIVALLAEGGLARVHDSVSDTAKYGGLTRGPRIVDAPVRASMRRVLGEIRDGGFAREWIAEVHAGMPALAALRRADGDHPLELVGRTLRSAMKEARP